MFYAHYTRRDNTQLCTHDILRDYTKHIQAKNSNLKGVCDEHNVTACSHSVQISAEVHALTFGWSRMIEASPTHSPGKEEASNSLDSGLHS
jgi:hypothetical protein